MNGATQRAYIRKEDASSPTVANESVFITSVIAAHEKCFVRCYDVPERFSTQNMMKCNDGTQERTGRDDGTHLTTNISTISQDG